MKNPIALCTLVFFIVTASFGQYPLEQTLGAPYTQSVFGSSEGQALAWVVNEAGIRNIWYAEIETGQAKKLTDYINDDGLDISQLAFTSDYMFYVRGNADNRKGQPANPASLPLTPKQQILRLNLTDRRIDTVAAAGLFQLSPSGQQLIYSSKGKVFMVEDISVLEIQPEVLFEVRDGAGSLNWSPDGKAIAFVSNRGDHSFVGYYSLSKQKIYWMAPTLSFDGLPVWSPDGKQIAFIRTPGQGKDELMNITGGVPFEIMVADVETGQAKSIWQSPGDDGGFAQYYPNKPLQWSKTNTILFYSEHEGWNHIYAINPDGSGLKDLTPGACEVENNNVSENGQYLYFTSNCGDINRRHIWKVNISSGKSTQVTDERGIQTNPVPLADDYLAYREATYNEPTAAVLQKGGDKQVFRNLPEGFPKNQMVKPLPVQFKAADGITVHGQLFIPEKGKNNDLPAVIFMHGGPIRQMLLGYHYSGYYANAYILNQYLASRGYVVLSINYRDGIGYGRDFRRAENQGPRGASEYKDIIAAGKFLQSLPEVDADRLGLWGGSYGGYLTAMGLAKNSDMFKAGVDLHGVHDWSWRARDFSPGGAWGITENLMDQAYHASPISELQYWSSPVLLITGDDDRNVMFGQSIDLKNKLDKLGVYNEVLVFPDEVHGFLRYDSWLRAYQSAVDFFDRFLKESKGN